MLSFAALARLDPRPEPEVKQDVGGTRIPVGVPEPAGLEVTGPVLNKRYSIPAQTVRCGRAMWS